MLRLSRRIDEQVIILDTKTGEEICAITFCGIKGSDTAKLGFVASDRYAIHRQEVWEQIKAGGTK